MSAHHDDGDDGDNERDRKPSRKRARPKRPPKDYADAPYPVGKYKPPLHTRFVKGESGHPDGRPPKKKKDAPKAEVLSRKDFDKMTLDVLMKQLEVGAADGSKTTITALQGLNNKLIRDALQGKNTLRTLAYLERVLERVAPAVPDIKRIEYALVISLYDARADTYFDLPEDLAEEYQRRKKLAGEGVEVVDWPIELRGVASEDEIRGYQDERMGRAAASAHAAAANTVPLLPSPSPAPVRVEHAPVACRGTLLLNGEPFTQVVYVLRASGEHELYRFDEEFPKTLAAQNPSLCPDGMDSRPINVTRVHTRFASFTLPPREAA